MLYHEGTLVPPGEYDWTCASFGHPSPQPKRQVDWLSHFCTAHGRKSLYFTMGTLSPIINPSYRGSGPHLIYDSLGPSEPTSQTASQSVQLFFCTMGRPFYLQKLPLPRGSGPPSNTWFSVPTRVLNPNGISIGSAVFAGLTCVADRQITLLSR